MCAIRDLKQLYFEIISKLEENYKNSVKNFLHFYSVFIWASLVVQTVKSLPAVLVLILGLGRFPGEGNNYQLWYSGLENSMDRGAMFFNLVTFYL